MSIHIDIADDRWSEIVGLKTCLESAVQATRAVLESEDAAAQIAIRLSNNKEVQALNRTYRGKDAPTNVLSFPAMRDDYRNLFAEEACFGDIILALETVRHEAEIDGKDFASHAAHLIVHGMLHLAGYDHERQETAEEIESLEIRILQGIGIANPYM